jgi:hypothetical protein
MIKIETYIQIYNFFIRILDKIFAFFLPFYLYRYDLMVKLRVFFNFFSLLYFFFFGIIYTLHIKNLSEFFMEYRLYLYIILFFCGIIHSIIVYRRIKKDYLTSDFYELHLHTISNFCFSIIIIHLIFSFLTIHSEDHLAVTVLANDLINVIDIEEPINYINH